MTRGRAALVGIAVAVIVLVAVRERRPAGRRLSQVAEAPTLPREPLQVSAKPPAVDAAALALADASVADAAVAVVPAPRRQPPAPQRTPDPFVDALTATTPEGARLNADYARARLPVPPEARTLVAMRSRGVPQEQLVAYVRTSFPKGILVRAVALRWLGVGAAPGRVVHGGAAPGSTLVPAVQ
jgi:hypothetical protein